MRVGKYSHVTENASKFIPGKQMSLSILKCYQNLSIYKNAIKAQMQLHQLY
jgi:hypothetical protein